MNASLLVETQYSPESILLSMQINVFIHSRTCNMRLLNTYYVPGTEAGYTKYTGSGLKELRPGGETYSLEKQSMVVECYSSR